ncbi:MAG: 1-deoxy-D-xylulose-5-phosphate synthase [Deltaproteobacteria bacterium]|nr:1-deoxy-D-xylulose-5-phosphate synthase [Deltaproteobacteria bacterium]
MENLLKDIAVPADLKKLSVNDLPRLAKEVRELIVETVSSTGGHIASSLGAVEIAIAIHYVFDTPRDKVIWDVGHQAYAHKILTGRRDGFRRLRQLGGLSGFCKPSESPYDTVVSGHSSTSISSGLGIAAARDLTGEDYRVVCVIGDGGMTAGIAFEGLNQAGHLKKDMVVILNDNEMSISKNVGALSTFLSRKITGRLAMKVKNEFEKFVKSIPLLGEGLVRLSKKAEDSLVALLTPGMLFEGLGFHYIGPIDGHDVGELVSVLEETKTIKGPVLLHVLTKKGKGYGPAEQNPSLFHGIGPFDRNSGLPRPSKPTYTDVFSETLLEIAEKDKRVVAVTAAMPEGTGLQRFAESHPDRFFDVGIAEQHAITFAAGMAKMGFKPVTAIYSTFLQRAYDQVFHDICLDGLPVVIALDRSGLVGADGATHHGLFDISYLRHLPNMIVCAPKDESELRDMLWASMGYNGPVAIRYPRGVCPGFNVSGPPDSIPMGRAETLKQGSDVTIFALGTMVYPSLEAAGKLESSGIKAAVVNARFAKPLDMGCILAHAKGCGRIITVEENALAGGFGSAVLEALEQGGLRCDVKRLGVPDVFIEHGTQEELRMGLGLTAEGIMKAVEEMVKGSKRESGPVIVRAG